MIYLSAGSKGGVGKSWVAQLLIAHHKPENCIVIETDDSNPDVYKSSEGKVHQLHAISLREKSGWLKLIDVLEQSDKRKHIVINCQAADKAAFNSFSTLLGQALEILKREAIIFCTLDKDVDGANLLASMLKSKPAHTTLHAVLNKHFDNNLNEFVVTSKTEVLKSLADQGGQVLSVEKAEDVVFYAVKNDRKLISELIHEGMISQRIEASSVLNAFANELKKIGA
jgi:hypothetical protein